MENYSVLMSVYIKEKPQFLSSSINSILEQTVLTDDFVLVCDGPLTDDLNSVISKYVNKYPGLFNILRLEKNVGLGRALNAGMQVCRNELIARMDSDDISIKDRCERQLRKFESNPELDILSGTVLEFEGREDNIISAKKLPERNDDIHRYAKRRCPFNHPAVMYKKSSVLKAGGYLDFPLFEDYYLWIRMMRRGVTAYNIPEPVCLMRGGVDMYSRRGGMSYLKKAWRFRLYMLKNGYCGFADFFSSMTGQFIMAVLPARLRMYLYMKILRGREARRD